MWGGMIFCLLSITICIGLGLGNNIINIIMVISLYFLIIIIIGPINKRVWSRQLPLESLFNPFGLIEIHIGKKCNRDPMKLYYACLEVVKIAKKVNKNILIDTWLISEENVKRFFGDAAEILKPRFLQRFSNYLNKRRHAPKDKRESYRCLLHVDKITDKQIIILEQKIEKLNKWYTGRTKKENI